MKLKQKGLSLAELLAVVVIMGIIAAVAIPLISHVIDNTREKAIIADVNSYYDSIRLFTITDSNSPYGSEGSPLFVIGKSGSSIPNQIYNAKTVNIDVDSLDKYDNEKTVFKLTFYTDENNDLIVSFELLYLDDFIIDKYTVKNGIVEKS